ncbi:AsmA family protein [Sesbania bispinosa]|nr:AsmA family protein [Sesbania bispinosa]
MRNGKRQWLMKGNRSTKWQKNAIINPWDRRERISGEVYNSNIVQNPSLKSEFPTLDNNKWCDFHKKE